MLSPDRTHAVYGCRAPAAVSDVTPADIGLESALTSANAVKMRYRRVRCDATAIRGCATQRFG